MEELIKGIYDHYGYKALFVEEFQTGNYGISLKVVIEDVFHVVKVIPSEKDIFLSYVLPLMTYINTLGIGVPKPLKTNKGQYFCPVTYKEKAVFMYLYPMLEGHNLEDSVQGVIETGLFMSLGKEVAKLHSALNAYPKGKLINLKRWNETESLFVIYEDIHPEISENLITLYNQTKEEVEMLDIDMNQVVHCDLHMANILYDEKRGFTFLDMEDCVVGNRMMDISIVCFDLSVVCRLKKIYMKGIMDFLKGYESVMPLSSKEKEAFNLMLKLLEVASYINFYAYKEEQDPWLESFYSNSIDKILNHNIFHID